VASLNRLRRNAACAAREPRTKRLRARGVTLAVGLLAAVTPLRGNAQTSGPSPQAGVIRAVLLHRTNWMRDSTKVDACSVRRALPSPADFPSAIEPRLRRLLTATEIPCPIPPPTAVDTTQRRPRWGDVVQIDSLTIADTTATAFLHVVHGEEHHNERFTLGRDRSGEWWVVEVRQTGFVRTYYAPRRRSGPK
jgi:hypothetical protein